MYYIYLQKKWYNHVRNLLGHSYIKVTEKYLHMSNALFITVGKDNIYRLDKVFFKRFYDTFSTRF